MKHEDLKKMKCPMCGRDDCIQEIHCVDRNREYVKFRCTYINCGHEWINEEGTKFIAIRKDFIFWLDFLSDNAAAAAEALEKLKEVVERERQR